MPGSDPAHCQACHERVLPSRAAWLCWALPRRAGEPACGPAGCRDPMLARGCRDPMLARGGHRHGHHEHGDPAGRSKEGSRGGSHSSPGEAMPYEGIGPRGMEIGMRRRGVALSGVLTKQPGAWWAEGWQGPEQGCACVTVLSRCRHKDALVHCRHRNVNFRTKGRHCEPARC